MGTHSAVAVKRNSKIKSWESTMDGYILVDVFYEWIDGLIKTGKEPFEWTPRVEIGGGRLEIGDEREHDQSYFVGIDYDRKIVFTDIICIWPDKKNINEFVKRGYGLYKLGWRIRYGTDDDCLRGRAPKDVILYFAKGDDAYKVKLLDEDFSSEQRLKEILVNTYKILKSPTVKLVCQLGQDPSLIVNQMLNELRQNLDRS
jgi:hypothetical protein